MEDFQNVKSFGSGAFGQVFTGELDGKRYAIKSIKKGHIDEIQLGLEQAIGETNAHPFLCEIDYVFENEKERFFVMPYLSGGTLFDKIGKIKEKDVLKYAFQLIQAIGALHDKDIAHRDIKCENICLDDAGNVKVIDFGIAKVMSRGLMTKVGTEPYMAPELIGAVANYTKAVDWWAVGVVLYCLATGCFPFGGKGNCKQKIRTAAPPKFYPEDNCSADLQDLIHQLVKKKPEERLGSGDEDWKEILMHKAFKLPEDYDLDTPQLSLP